MRKIYKINIVSRDAEIVQNAFQGKKYIKTFPKAIPLLIQYKI